MKDDHLKRLRVIRRNCFFAAIFWFAMLGFSTVRDIGAEKEKTLALAHQATLTIFKKDVSLRLWSSSHGGVYVPVTDKMKPSPYLSHISERDVKLPSGRVLTLVNPAWMLRQIIEQFESMYGSKGKITSLKYMNPINKPDKWHREALKKFEKGIGEVFEEVNEENKHYIRLFRPLKIKKSCLKCHGYQGYKVGEVRGGVSVSVPIDNFREKESAAVNNTVISHGIFLIAGFIFISIFFFREKNFILEQIQTDKKIYKRENFISLLLNSTAEGIFGLDKDGICSMCNPSALKLLGFEREEEFVGKDAHPLIHHTKPSGEINLREDCKICETIETGKKNHVENDIFWRKDQTAFNAEYWSYPIMEDENIIGSVVTFIDVTERIKTLEALASSEKRYKDLAENSTDWIWEFDENDIITYSSPGVFNILGFTRKEITGKNFIDYISENEKKSFQEKHKKIKESKTPFSTIELKLLHRKKHPVTIEISGIPLSDERGNFRGFRGISRDITERKMFELRLRQAQKMEAIGTLSGGIAHDFNNILAAILGYSEIVKEELPDTRNINEYIDQIIGAGLRAKDLIRHLLAFSRKENENRASVKLSGIVREVLKLLRASIPTTIRIEENIQKNTGYINADSTQIHQVIMNLCTNASHAMDEEGTLTIVLKEATLTDHDFKPDEENVKAGKYLKLTVKDTGCGIEKEMMEKIFDPYYTTKDVGKGSGIGLTVVVGIVKSHDGIIRVESDIDTGTVFSVYFPAVKKTADKTGEDKYAFERGDEKILIIDDEIRMVELTKIRVESLGYVAETETDSTKALERFRASPKDFDLIITDQTMPGITGDRLAKEILEIRPDIPIILSTGYSSKVDEKSADLIGIKAFVMKPVDKKVLAMLIRKLLDEKKDL